MNYECARCRVDINAEKDEKQVKLRCDEIMIIKKFSYLGGMPEKNDSNSKVVMSPKRAGW